VHVLGASTARRNLVSSDRRAGKRRDLSIAISRAEDQERRALAKDLHDDLGQMLAVLALKVWTIKKLNPAKELCPAIDDCTKVVAQVNDKLRSMALQLTPPMLDQRGLVPTLSWLAGEVQRVYGIRVEFKDDGLAKLMDPVVGSVLYRAVRELLFNAIRHSGTTGAIIETRLGEGNTMIAHVTDSGGGFEAESLEAISSSDRYGLLLIRERLSFLGGTLSIRSRPGAGTQVTIQVPLSLVDKVDSRKGVTK
jgi:signal transduction histidine kinase